MEDVKEHSSNEQEESEDEDDDSDDSDGEGRRRGWSTYTSSSTGSAMSFLSNRSTTETSVAKWRSAVHRKLSLTRDQEQMGAVDVPELAKECMQAVDSRRKSEFGSNTFFSHFLENRTKFK